MQMATNRFGTYFLRSPAFSPPQCNRCYRLRLVSSIHGFSTSSVHDHDESKKKYSEAVLKELQADELYGKTPTLHTIKYLGVLVKDGELNLVPKYSTNDPTDGEKRKPRV